MGTHTCEQPPNQARGTLWRCWCGKLWKLGYICDTCDFYNGAAHHGQCVVMDSWGRRYKWRPALLKTRILHRLHTRAWRERHEVQVSLPERLRELESRMMR